MDNNTVKQLINEVGAAASYAADAASNGTAILEKLDEVIRLLKRIANK
ncbi:hypothetical protein [Leifsonia xyli]|jgi:hypothetical protein|nr:hypothetical protein [Leifsonia xyli]